MKKLLPYTIGVFAFLVLVLLVIYTPVKRARKPDERITLRQQDKILYGTYMATRLLHATFSKAHMVYDMAPPGYWNGVDTGTVNQAVFLISTRFDPEADELDKLAHFIEKGNYVFIITKDIGVQAAAFFGIEADANSFTGAAADGLTVSLRAPAATALYQYPGKRFDSYFSSIDTATMLPLGSNAEGNPNFIQLQSGGGRLFVHLAPLAFSNYFLLHKNNIAYFQHVVSLLPHQVHTIVWNEYYLSKKRGSEKEPNVLRVLWQHQPFRSGLITAVITLLVYVLSAMRRRQRLIPTYEKPANASLDFVRTIGRLYYGRRDHHNLSKKMAAYFIEHVQSRYKMQHPTPDELFVAELHTKSHYDAEELKKIIDFIQYINTYTFITEQELARFYRQLHLFYKNTDGAIV